MSVEDKLRRLVLSRYPTMKAFAEDIGMPQSTLETMLKRGLRNTNVSNIAKICRTLNLSADALAQGEIEYLDRDANNKGWYQSIIDAYDAAPTLVQKVVCDALHIAYAPSPGVPGDPDEWLEGGYK